VAFGLVAGAVLARTHGRMDEARRLAQRAHDMCTEMGDSYLRGYASTQLARAALGLGDVTAARSLAVEALLVARRLLNRSQMGYALSSGQRQSYGTAGSSVLASSTRSPSAAPG
jgi:ATP/maltotriose-dependent transcriptional regulator MalT